MTAKEWAIAIISVELICVAAISLGRLIGYLLARHIEENYPWLH